MKKILVSAAVVALGAIAFAASRNADPVLLTVDGKPVYKSEFEYIYHKTNSQQLTPQTIEEYLPLFIDYRLKVAEGDAVRVDTTAEFRDEVEKYRRELAQAHMIDSAVYQKLYDEVHDFAGEEVKVAHIMLPASGNKADNEKRMATLDSLRLTIVNSPDPDAAWRDAAARFSVDTRSKDNGGLYSWINPFTLPFWPFVKAAYTTGVGEVSEAVNSGAGLHLIKPLERRPARGEVKVAHILMLTQRMSEEDAKGLAAVMDSIYEVAVAPGADFADLARRFSQDPGSASRGGIIDWFGTGQMVNEFDSIAFATPEGSITRPFRTAYGYHIIKNLGHRDMEASTLDRKIRTSIGNDERGEAPRRAYISRIVADFGGKLLPDGLDKVKEIVKASAGGLTPELRTQLENSSIPVARINGKDISMGEASAYLAPTVAGDADRVNQAIADAANAAMENAAVDADLNRFATINADYRNTLNEYINGNKLFAVQFANVYDKAAKDREGLEKFFNDNRTKYTWDKPKYKGFIVFCNNDSLMQLAQQYCDSIGDNLDREAFASQISKRFGRGVKAERIIAAHGDNAISDYLFFNGPRPADKELRYKYFFGFGGHLAQQPEEALDVRSAVVTDYQDALMNRWVESLRKKYKVKIDRNVLKSCK